ncbi:MAG: EamA family transporter [Elusimicrobia bacterium]|nr:EamA family transporter [Elusimicrobiota bacterium]
MITRRALFLLVSANVLGGSAYAFAGYALKAFSPLELVFWRTLLASVLFLPFLFLARPLKFTREEWARMAFVGVFGYAAPLLIGNIGQKLSSATNASLLIGTEPVAIVLLSAVFLREPLTLLKIIAIAGGVTGAAFIVCQGIPFVNVSIAPHWRGDLLLLLHGILWALYSIVGKPVLRRVDPMIFTAITTLFGLAAMSLMLLPTMGAPRVGSSSFIAVASLVYLGLGVSFLGTIVWNKGLELVPASLLANFIFLQPLVGVILGVGLHRDRFTLWSAAGGVLILAGVYFAAKNSESSRSLDLNSSGC